ncbi:MAG: tyrosine-type recombinase/integrase [Candidatus Diapherotrites archaeon]
MVGAKINPIVLQKLQNQYANYRQSYLEEPFLQENKDKVVEYLNERELNGFSPHSNISFVQSIKRLSKEYPDTPFIDLTKKDMSEYCRNMLNGSFKVNTKFNKLLALLKSNKKISITEMKRVLKCSDSFAWELINKLIENYEGFSRKKDGTRVSLVMDKNAEVPTVNTSKKYSVHSYNGSITPIKTFFKWLNKGTAPESVSWIKIRQGPKKVNWEDILSEKEIKQMIEAAENPRDKCIISMTWEGGLRVSELTNLTIGSLIPHPEYPQIYQVTVSGKTGERTLPFITSAPLIRQWLQWHPAKDEPDIALFVPIGTYKNKFRNYPIRATSILSIVKKTAKKAGIKKHVFVHLLRHSRITNLIDKNLNNLELNKFGGWSDASNTSAIYTHLSNSHLTNKLLKPLGLKKEMEAKPLLNILTCEICTAENHSTREYCIRCGAPLSIKTVMKERDLDQKEKEIEERLLILLDDIRNRPELSTQQMLQRLKAR